ncbi:ABC transporter ATP-binding protein [Rubrimonas cliftonensis]|uniref:Peptide/nickel transport system ATP-binding protein n=1 Tax=Rubrimonas cliftonensis TaxID=89524 RepID=A0A1H4GE30_9RHOB|nr:ATP-binding cassette domain-containing protein [Rubrimonas cliftonensis]SEB07737.1 peptide/nickel transport system ATP-binding protein [Rubrimonas cliftonensis]
MTLRVDDLRVSTGGRRLVGPVGFTVEPGRPLVILGETGAGKSLIAQAVMGSLPRGLIASGAVSLDGARVDALPRGAREALWGRRIAILPQEPWRALDPLMRNLSQVAETHAEVAGQDWAQARTLARADLADLGLGAQAAAARPGQLSGGMAQRVAFAAATAAGARTLLADEPTKGLDDARRNDVARLLRRFVEGGGVLIAITHDIAVARALGGDVMILRDGEVLETGPSERILSDPQSDYGRALVEADPENWPFWTSTAAGAPVLAAEAITVGRGGRALLGGLTFALREGARIGVIGPSGLGKTSLLDTLAGLIEPMSGRLLRHGAGERPLAVQKLFQDPPAAFAPLATLAEQFRDLARRHGLVPQAIPALMQRLGLAPELLDRRPAQVSGGELQRLALARVLALRPAAILADEPTSRLDPVTQRNVMAVIGEAAEEAGAAVMLVTHNGALAQRWAGTVLDLARHAVAAEGVVVQTPERASAA